MKIRQKPSTLVALMLKLIVSRDAMRMEPEQLDVHVFRNFRKRQCKICTKPTQHQVTSRQVTSPGYHSFRQTYSRYSFGRCRLNSDHDYRTGNNILGIQLVDCNVRIFTCSSLVTSYSSFQHLQRLCQPGFLRTQHPQSQTSSHRQQPAFRWLS